MNAPYLNPALPFGTGNAAPALFCLPYAGGGASLFLGWRKALPGITLAPLQYPGHETRLGEACANDIRHLASELATALQSSLMPGQAYGLLGYSLGARLAYLLVQELALRGCPPPCALHVVAHRPPDAPPNVAGVADMDHDRFRAHVSDYGGTPAEVFDTPALAEVLLPILRADFALAEQTLPHAVLDCPIHAYAGAEDKACPPDGMRAWQRFTQGGFSLRTFDGGHFFARQSPAFLSALAQDIANWRA